MTHPDSASQHITGAGILTAQETKKCRVSTPMQVDRKPRQKMEVL